MGLGEYVCMYVCIYESIWMYVKRKKESFRTNGMDMTVFRNQRNHLSTLRSFILMLINYSLRFDCVYPTRTARFGVALVENGSIRLKASDMGEFFLACVCVDIVSFLTTTTTTHSPQQLCSWYLWRADAHVWLASIIAELFSMSCLRYVGASRSR